MTVGPPATPATGGSAGRSVLLAVAALLAVFGAPVAAAASAWCDPNIDPMCFDDTYPDAGYGDPYATTWYDDTYPDAGYGDPYGTTWYDDSYPDAGYGDPYGTTWYDDTYPDAGYEDPYSSTWHDEPVARGDGSNGRAAVPPDLLAMLDAIDVAGQRNEGFDPTGLPVGEAAHIGAARLVLGIDALAELGAFRRDPDPAINDAIRQVRDRIGADGLDAEGYRFEIAVLAEDLGELVDILDAAGTLGEPLIDVAADLADLGLRDRLDQGATGLYDPNTWLSAAADLLIRQGAEPVFEDERDADLPSVLALADGLGAPVESDQASTTTTVTVATQPTPAAEPDDLEPAESTTGDGPGSMLVLAAAAAVALAAVIAGLAGRGRRRRRPPDDDAPSSNDTVAVVPVVSAPVVAGRSQASLEDLLEVSRRMTSSLDMVEVAEIALAEAERLVAAEGGLLVVRTDDGLRVLCHRPAPLFDLEALDRGATRRVMETGRSIVQVTDDEPCLVEVPMALAAIPIVADGTVAGAILVVRVPTEPFARQELDGLEMLAPLIGSAIRAAEAHGSAAMLADIDPLSGVNNRRRLTADLAMGAERPLATIMIDVDHFKHFNDTNGHAAGDEALRRVAQLMSDSVRPGDVVYRYGGEEFCVLLPDTLLDEAAVVAERIRAAVEAADIPGGENQPAGRVTISVGVARSEPGGHLRVIEAADAALYRAKHGGRNQVCASAD